MGELNKAQLAEKVSELQLQIEKLTSEGGIAEALKEKETIIAELTAKVESLEVQVSEQTSVIEGLSKDNATIEKVGTFSHKGEAYTLIAPKFHMDGALVSAETLKGNVDLIARAIELKFLVPTE